MRKLSAPAIKSVLEHNSDDVWLTLLEISETSLGAPIRVVNNNEDIISNGLLFQAFHFETILPDSDISRLQSVKINIFDIVQQIMPKIRQAQGDIDVKLSAIRASAPNEIEVGPIKLRLNSIEWVANKITGQASAEDWLNKPVCPWRMDEVNAPGLF